MDDEADGYAESASGATTDNPGSSSYGGAIFSRSHHFTVAGGTFNNNFNNVTNKYTGAPVVPPDFRVIPMGDIDLLEEIRLNNETGVVGRHHPEMTRVRRMYSAKIDGRKLGVTVAMYQGNSAEEEWRQDIANYMTVRHPNIVQLHAAASVNNMHAAVFHDDLIPFEQFLDRYSPILKVYIHGYCVHIFEIFHLPILTSPKIADFLATRDYFSSVFQRDLWEDSFTIWIRRSSGRLCADLIPSNTMYWTGVVGGISGRQGIKSLDPPNQEAIAIDGLTLEQYHAICYWNLSRRRNLCGSASATVNLNAIIACPSGDRLEDWVEIALLLDEKVYLDHWTTPERATGEVTDGGWTCFASSDIFDTTLDLYIWNRRGKSWLSQANHVFSRLGITSNFEDYVIVDDIWFCVKIAPTTEDPPMGYLFLCPAEDFQIGSLSFRWPECPAYWSLDPSGVEHLSMEDATALGFPSISLSTKIEGWSWDSSVYTGLRQFHRVKGFDPDTQDVARHLGERLYRLASEIDSLFAHVDEDYYSDEDDQDPSDMDNSDDTRSLASEDDGEPTDIDDWAVLLPSVDDEDSCAEQVQYPLDINEAENSQNSPDNRHVPESMARNEPLSPGNDEMPVSRAFKFFMNIQFALIMFLALCWLYDHVWSGPSGTGLK